jgi:hypothetical protein
MGRGKKKLMSDRGDLKIITGADRLLTKVVLVYIRRGVSKKKATYELSPFVITMTLLVYI